MKLPETTRRYHHRISCLLQQLHHLFVFLVLLSLFLLTLSDDSDGMVRVCSSSEYKRVVEDTCASVYKRGRHSTIIFNSYGYFKHRPRYKSKNILVSFSSRLPVVIPFLFAIFFNSHFLSLSLSVYPEQETLTDTTIYPPTVVRLDALTRCMRNIVTSEQQQHQLIIIAF